MLAILQPPEIAPHALDLDSRRAQQDISQPLLKLVTLAAA
jgi:hypothetical protein